MTLRRIAPLTFGLLAAVLLGAAPAQPAPRAGARYLGVDPLAAPALAAASSGDSTQLSAPAGGALAPPYLDDEDASIAYTGTWTARLTVGALYGTVHESRTVGNTAAIPFQGARVTLYYLPVRGGGIVDVYLDTVDLAHRVGTINQSRLFRPKAWALELAGLPATEPHTLVLRHRYGRRVNFDALAWRDAAVETPAFGASEFHPLPGTGVTSFWQAAATSYLSYRGLWTVWPNTTSNSWRRRDTATFAFTGDAFILYFWMAKRDYSLGRMKVFIDGVPAFKYPIINQRAGKKGWWLFYWTDLPGGPQHTIQVKHVRGKRINLEGFAGFDLTLP